MNEKIIVGLSGGVDSSVSLVMLKEQGFIPIGLSLRFRSWNNIVDRDKPLEVAKSLCEKYKCEHIILDVERDFQNIVVSNFVNSLNLCETPNPCVFCNRYFKFATLLGVANKLNARYIATGHYAKVVRHKKYGVVIAKAFDSSKDQSYYLSLLPQEWLLRIKFPCGEYTKDQIYGKAKFLGMSFFERIKESQDFCYLPNNVYNKFVDCNVKVIPGNIVDVNGCVIGKHKGLPYYTIGQRRGIRLSGGPFWVVGKNIENNELIVSKDVKDLFKKECNLENVFLVCKDLYERNMNLQVKIRYNQDPMQARLIFKNNGEYKLIFDSVCRAVTPGQFAVFYDNDICLGCGVIQ